ncbi:hypothetical protein [Cupriavidus basilensis]|uniref:hypothetical protein n=1 Tax=Cupriavidus basilensis TaxID=68895 RepID=UPI003204EC92
MKGHNLQHLTLPVAPWEAALGPVVPIHLPGCAFPPARSAAMGYACAARASPRIHRVICCWTSKWCCRRQTPLKRGSFMKPWPGNWPLSRARIGEPDPSLMTTF